MQHIQNFLLALPRVLLDLGILMLCVSIGFAVLGIPGAVIGFFAAIALHG